VAQGSLIRPPPQAQASADGNELPPLKHAPVPDLGRALFRELEAESGEVEFAEFRSVPAYSGIELTWAHRAAMAVELGHPSELRRIAQQMALAGSESEAGLLNNYALLLERSRSSQARVLAEVTRMLQSASAERQTAVLERRERMAEGAAPGAPSPVAVAGADPRGASDRARAAQEQAPLVPMPVLPIGEKRRAG
jgi:hypothetical protein